MWDQLDIPFDGWEIYFRNTVSLLLKKKAQKAVFFTQKRMLPAFWKSENYGFFLTLTIKISLTNGKIH